MALANSLRYKLALAGAGGSALFFGTAQGARQRKAPPRCRSGNFSNCPSWARTRTLLIQLITLYITPVVYTYLDALQQRLARRKVPESREYAEPGAGEPRAAGATG